MTRGWRRVAFAFVCGAAAAGCFSQPEARSGALDYLARTGSEEVPEADLKLTPPLRIGVALPPSETAAGPSRAGLPPSVRRVAQSTIPERLRQVLLTRLTTSLQGRAGIGSVDVIPSSYLTAGGGFAELQRAGGAFGYDLVALVSWDQFQFGEGGRESFELGTIAGERSVEGEPNETKTVLDTALFHVASRELVLHATGESSVKSDASRDSAEAGFDAAMKDLLARLDTAAAAFAEQLKHGRVHGLGTPEFDAAAPGGAR